MLNPSVVKRHLVSQHSSTLAAYTEQFRAELERERRCRPLVAASHTLEGWWEGCLYSCRYFALSMNSQNCYLSSFSSTHFYIAQPSLKPSWGVPYFF